MCADDSIYTFCNCLNDYKRRGLYVSFFSFFPFEKKMNLSHHITALGVVIVGRFQCITPVLSNNKSLSSIPP